MCLKLQTHDVADFEKGAHEADLFHRHLEKRLESLCSIWKALLSCDTVKTKILEIGGK